MTADSDSTPTKTCTKCGQCKPETVFTKTISAAGAPSRRAQCNTCRAAINREIRLRDDVTRKNSETRQLLRSLKHDGLKPCKTCGQVKPLDEFREKSSKDSYTANCKVCAAAAGRAEYHKNKPIWAARAQDYRSRNRAQISEKNAEYVRKNRQATTDRQARWAKEKRKVDPLFALKMRLRSMLSDVFRNGGYTKKARAVEILGCDWADFHRHIEMQFAKGMNWGNRGAWEVDHIVPISTAKTEEDIVSLNHFTNLRPLWAVDNNAKGDKRTHLI